MSENPTPLTPEAMAQQLGLKGLNLDSFLNLDPQRRNEIYSQMAHTKRVISLGHLVHGENFRLDGEIIVDRP